MPHDCGEHFMHIIQGIRLRINRFGAALSVLVAGAVRLSACGGNNNASKGSATAPAPSAKAACGGKPPLKASASAAQANGMVRFVTAFERACPGQSLNYTGNGS